MQRLEEDAAAGKQEEGPAPCGDAVEAPQEEAADAAPSAPAKVKTKKSGGHASQDAAGDGDGDAAAPQAKAKGKKGSKAGQRPPTKKSARSNCGDDAGEAGPHDASAEDGHRRLPSELPAGAQVSTLATPRVKGRVRFTYNMAAGVTKSDVIPKEEVFEFHVERSSEFSCWRPLGCVTLSDPGPPRRGRTLWQYAGNHAMVARALPEVNGPRTRSVLLEKEVFWVREERTGEDDQLFLRLADDRGWVFAYSLRGEPLFARIELPFACLDSGWTLWQFTPPSNDTMLRLRKEPERDSDLTGESLEPLDIFWAVETTKGRDGTKFLCLPNNQGWAFERRPRSLCLAFWENTLCCVPIPIDTSGLARPYDDDSDDDAPDFEPVEVRWHFAKLKLTAATRLAKPPLRPAPRDTE